MVSARKRHPPSLNNGLETTGFSWAHAFCAFKGSCIPHGSNLECNDIGLGPERLNPTKDTQRFPRGFSQRSSLPCSLKEGP